jgi:hypothetical protein
MRFNSLNARENAARSVAARKQAREQRLANRNGEAAQEPLAAEEQESSNEEFRVRRLSRVRLQQAELDDRIEKQMRRGDAKVIQALAQASRSLCEQEFSLSGRPWPGNRRHAMEQPRSRQVINLAPLPIGVPVTAAPVG